MNPIPGGNGVQIGNGTPKHGMVAQVPRFVKTRGKVPKLGNRGNGRSSRRAAGHANRFDPYHPHAFREIRPGRADFRHEPFGHPAIAT